MYAYGATLGRLILGVFFLTSGLTKFMGEPMAIQMMAQHGFPMPAFFFWAAAILEVFGGAALILGMFTSMAAILLALFTLAAGITIHDFWNDAVGSMERMSNLINFEKNLAIFGGLLVLAAYGPGPFAVRLPVHEPHMHPAE